VAGIARTQEDRKAETRGKLLAAAADLFARKGFHAVSTDAVADAADRTSGALYAHFGGKEGLLLALVNQWENQAADQIGRALLDESDLAGRLDALWTTFLASSTEAENPWMLLEHELWLHGARNPEIADGLAKRYGDARTAMGVSYTTWAEQEGEELPVTGDQLAVLMLALLLGLEMQRRVDPKAVSDDLAVQGLELLFGRRRNGTE
jgi:AcrR family transcriptional regulator